MYSKPYSFSIHLSDDEGRIIQNVIREKIAKAGWNNFFTDLKTDGDSAYLIDVYQKIDKNEVIVITSFQLHLLIEMLRKTYSKFHIDSIKILIDSLKEIA